MQLNAPEELGHFLKCAGIETVKIVPTAWIANESKQVIVYISIQEGDRLYRQIEDKLKYVVEDDAR